jgi:hypothetical protein
MLPLTELTVQEAQAYDVLVDIVPLGSPVNEEGFSKLTEHPKDAVAERNGWAPSTARLVLTKLKRKGLFYAERKGSNTWDWWVKLPNDGPAGSSRPQEQPLNLDTAMNPSETVEKVNRLLRAVADKLISEKQRSADLQDRLQELESELAEVREQNDNAATAISNLKVPDELPDLLQG